jgi:cytochrome c556
MVQRRFLLAGVIAFLSLFITSHLFSDVIKDRKKLMRANNKASKELKKAVAAKDFAAIEKHARDLASQMEKLPTLFPKGTTADNSRAKAAIWKKWASFKGKAASMGEVAGMVAEAAAAKDADKVALLAKSIAGGTRAQYCSGCHKSFRGKKKKKKM